MSSSSAYLTFEPAHPPREEFTDVEDIEATAEWSLPARHVAALVLAVLAACVALALLG